MREIKSEKAFLKKILGKFLFCKSYFIPFLIETVLYIYLQILFYTSRES